MSQPNPDRSPWIGVIFVLLFLGQLLIPPWQVSRTERFSSGMYGGYYDVHRTEYHPIFENLHPALQAKIDGERLALQLLGTAVVGYLLARYGSKAL